MELTLKNIGIIKDSTIKLDGLTVITGPNNSGKSTAGKALYSIIEGTNKIEEKRERELMVLFSRNLWTISKMLNFERIARDIDISHMDEDEKEWFAFFMNYEHGYRKLDSIEEKYIGLKDFLNGLSEERLSAASNKPQSEWTKRFTTYLKNFNEALQNAKKVLERIDSYIDDPSHEKYIKNNLLSVFLEEFKGQIFPVRLQVKGKDDRKSRVSLSRNGEIGCDITILNNERVANVGNVFNTALYQDVFYIDDPYDVDKLSEGEESFYFNRSMRFSPAHSSKLQRELLAKDSTPLEQAIAQEEYERVFEDVNSIIPGDIAEKSGSYFYVEDSVPPLRIENLATGSKMFAIIKSLISKGKITLNTMLILDEPEAHLHPAWQNLFAQFIVTLIKEYGVTVLLTTHSPNFLMALDTFSSINNIIEKTNFYHVKHLEDNYMIEYININGHLSEAYSSFTDPLIELQTKKKR